MSGSKTSRITAAALAFAITMIPAIAFAGGPAGHPDSIEYELRKELQDMLTHSRTADAPTFTLLLKAFLLDNRRLINLAQVEDHRVVDAVICVYLRDYDYRGFEKYQDNAQFRDWCEMLHQTVGQ